MKALVRRRFETITQDTDLSFINWNTGAPLTNDSWSGGPYVLVENYDPTMYEDVSPDEFAEKAKVETRNSESEGAVTESPSTVTYGGKEYTLEELKKLIG